MRSMVYKVMPWSVLNPPARGHFHSTAMKGTVGDLRGTSRPSFGYTKSVGSGHFHDSDEGHGGGSMIQRGDYALRPWIYGAGKV
jgi:hypothetical protein